MEPKVQNSDRFYCGDSDNRTPFENPRYPFTDGNVVKPHKSTMKGKLYHIARKVLKLPRPNEIWEGAENKWNFSKGLLYYRYTSGTFLGWAGMFLGMIQTVGIYGDRLGITGWWGYVAWISGGLFLVALGGHAMVVLNVMKLENTLTQSQNKEFIEIRDGVRELLKR